MVSNGLYRETGSGGWEGAVEWHKIQLGNYRDEKRREVEGDNNNKEEIES